MSNCQLFLQPLELEMTLLLSCCCSL